MSNKLSKVLVVYCAIVSDYFQEREGRMRGGNFDFFASIPGLRNLRLKKRYPETPTSVGCNGKINFELAAVHQFVLVKSMVDRNSPPWINKELRHLIREKYTT
jgi:hypothetical protein